MTIYINGVEQEEEVELVAAIGIEWNQAVDEWNRIDEYGDPLNLVTTDFNRHAIWGGMRRCTLAADGSVNHYGANPRGDGLDLTGADGRVMVEIPKFYVKSLSPAANVYRWWISEKPKVGFELHPAFVQRGGIERDYIYTGAYEADLEYNGDNEAYNAAHKELHSRTGVQPMTSGQIWEIQFDGGQNEPTIGNDVGTATDDNFFIVNYLVTGGAWVTNDATGYLWLRKPGDSTCGWVDNEQINNNTQLNILADGGAGLGVNGAPVALPLTISDARTLAGNIGARWGITNIWTLGVIQLLYFIEYANPNSQTEIGEGIVRKADGTGFAGELTGFESMDTEMGVNGTGAGSGTNGYTPIAYRGIENLWGNTWQFVDGYNTNPDNSEYQIARRDGKTIFVDDIDSIAGNYEGSVCAPLTDDDGYISNIEYEDLFRYLFIPSATDGSSTTYIPDYFFAHDINETNILLFSAHWNNAGPAGVACLNSKNVAAFVLSSFGGRLEFV